MFSLLPRLLLVSGCALIAGLASNSIRAEGVEPPSEFLHEATNNIIAGSVVAVDPAGKIVFDKLADLFGKDPAPQQIVLIAPKWLLGQVSKGEHYVVAYTAYSRSQLLPETMVLNPGGPVLLVGPGLEPALFRDTPTAREVFAEHDEEQRDSRKYLQRVLAGLSDADLQYQNYYAAELALNTELQARLGSADMAQVGKLAGNPRIHPSARSWLLRFAAQRAKSAKVDWLDTTARQVIVELPVGGHLSADDFSAGLALTAFSVLQDRQSAVELAALARWIASDSPALAEQALMMIRRQAPGQEKPLIEQALSRSLLSADTRTFLHDHLRRLALMEKALDATQSKG